MAQFTVTSATVKEKAQELGTQNDQLKKQIETLDEIVKKLSSMWEGSAHDAFNAKYGASRQKMTAFVNEIEAYRVALDQIACNYAESEKRNIETAQA